MSRWDIDPPEDEPARPERDPDQVREDQQDDEMRGDKKEDGND